MSKKIKTPTTSSPRPVTIKLERWQDESGNTFSTERLKIESRDWDAKTWERYLQTLDGPQTETLLDNYDRVLYASDIQCSLEVFFAEEYGEAGPKIKVSPDELNQAIGHLTGNQQMILRRHFWEGKSFEEIAQNLGKTKAAVWQTAKLALKRIETELLSGERKGAGATTLS